MPESTRNLLMMMGLACFSVGILLMFYHRRVWLSSLRSERHPAALLFETHKFRRRVILAGMIAACGTGLSALYWARDPRVIAAITGLVLILILFILWLAFRDLLIVSFYQMGQADKPAQRELMRRYEELKRQRQIETEGTDVNHHQAAAAKDQEVPPQPNDAQARSEQDS
ncbi:MAG TPA: hypothetical protein PKD54_00240 [Pirellulaceae bacterium]|nr:hypothetical protein [Pirellulaceae bacterium]